ncbi:MAG: TonB-dependent receptor [Pseudomonadota bacterium]
MSQSDFPRLRGTRHGLASCLLTLLLMTSIAAGQDAAPASAAEPAPATPEAPVAAEGQVGTPPDDDGIEPGVVLPDIIITSQKFKQRLEDVPASVSQISGEFINGSGKTNFQDLAEYLPNVSISLSHSDSLFTIRGLSTQDTNPGFDPSVGTVIDGVFYGRGQFLAAYFMDIDSLEVLRGPQGTLFGKNATAGVFNLTTREPDRELQASVELQSSGLGDRAIRPAINIPLGESWGLRFAANFNDNPNGKQINTFLNRVEGDEKVESMRLRLGYDGGHGLKLVVSGFQSRFGQNNNEFKFLRLTDGMRDLVQSYDPQINTDDRGDFRNSANFDSRKESIITGASGTLETEVDGLFGVKQMTLSLIGGYAEAKTPRSDLDADFSPVPFIHDQVAEPKLYSQVSQELRLNGKSPDLFGHGHGLNFVGGLYFASSEYRTSDIFVVEDLGAAYQYCSASDGFCALGLPAPVSLTSFISNVLGAPNQGQVSLAQLNDVFGVQQADVSLRQTNPTYGIFTQFEYFFSPELAVIGGLRYTYEEKTAVLHSFSDSEIIKRIAAQEDFDRTLTRIESDFAPKFGLKWKFNEDVDLYATWGKAFKSGGYNGFPLNPNNLEYEPEEASSYEFGIKAKAELFGGPVRISGAGFLTQFDNLQVSTFQGGNFIVLNAAKAQSLGGEMDFRWRPPVLGGFVITSSAGYTEATYLEYRNAPAISDSGDVNQDLTGKSLPHAPRWTGSFIPSYEVELTPNFLSSAAVEVLYRSQRFLDVDDDPRKLQKDTTMINAHLTLGAASQLWAVTLGVQNFTNVVVYDQALNQPLAPGNISGVRTDNGRYYTANLSVAF